MAKKFPSEMSSRGTVKVTDKLLIHNIDTGATEFTTVSQLLATFNIAVSSSNVGIGTVVPTATLDLQNTTLPQIDFHTGANKRADIRASLATLFLNSITGSDIQFQTDSVTKVTISSAGNVGIGTDAPTSKLQVTGLTEYNDNANAAASGLTSGAFYRTGDLLKVVH
jgi:hypothetical protein